MLLLNPAVCFGTDAGTLPLKHTIGHLPVLSPGFFVGNFEKEFGGETIARERGTYHKTYNKKRTIPHFTSLF